MVDLCRADYGHNREEYFIRGVPPGNQEYQIPKETGPLEFPFRLVMWFHSVERRQGFAADPWNDKDWILLVLKLS